MRLPEARHAGGHSLGPGIELARERDRAVARRGRSVLAMNAPPEEELERQVLRQIASRAAGQKGAARRDVDPGRHELGAPLDRAGGGLDASVRGVEAGVQAQVVGFSRNAELVDRAPADEAAHAVGHEGETHVLRSRGRELLEDEREDLAQLVERKAGRIVEDPGVVPLRVERRNERREVARRAVDAVDQNDLPS